MKNVTYMAGSLEFHAYHMEKRASDCASGYCAAGVSSNLTPFQSPALGDPYIFPAQAPGSGQEKHYPLCSEVISGE